MPCEGDYVKEYKDNNEIAIIILHEIYGVNKFIEERCAHYHELGLDVYCPSMLNRDSFAYKDSAAAYDYFFSEVGFGIYKKIQEQIEQLKKIYKRVFVLGFSIGATIAWRCSENSVADGIICCYGSRIRDYLLVQPSCPTLLLFAEHDSFALPGTIRLLKEKDNIEIITLKAHHGFLDKYSGYYDEEQFVIARAIIDNFINKYKK